MSDLKHTPAPWTYRPCPCGHRACRQHTVSPQGSVGFELADAMLIAAAPELYEALTSARACIALSVGDKGGILGRIEAALAKATGQ